MSRSGRGGSLKVGLDFIALTLMAITILTVLFGGLGGYLGADQASQNLAHFLLEFEFSGLIMAVVSRTIIYDAVITVPSFNRERIYIVGSLAGGFILNLVVPPSGYNIHFLNLFNLSLASANQYTTVIIAVPEETMFRLWLAPWLGSISHTGVFGGAIGSAALWTAFHYFVFGTQPGKLIIVFGVGIIYGVSALRTKLLSTSLAPHFINNFVSLTGI